MNLISFPRRFLILALCGGVSGAPQISTDSPTPLRGGVIAVWLGGRTIDRDAILDLPVVQGGQAVVQWAQVEPEKGRYDFSALDAQLADYARRKLPVTIQLNGNRKPAYLFNEVPYVREGGREVRAFVQVQNREGTLMYRHTS